MTSKLDEISEAIGQLRAEVRGLGEQQKAANDSRKAIYEKLEEMDDKIVAADARIASVDDRLESVEGPVAEFNKWRERGIGAVMLISFAAASVGGLLVAFGKKIWAVIGGT